MGSKTGSSARSARVWLAFVGELLWIGFHFDNVLCFDLDTWGWGIRVRWSGGEQGALTRYRGRRAGMGESGRAPIELLLWGWGREECGDGRGRLPKLWTGDASGLAVVRDGETGPRRRSPRGTPPGALGPMLMIWGACGLEGVPETCSGDSQRSVEYPEDSRRILSLGKPLGQDGRSGGTPKRAPIPTRNGRALERPARFGRGMGWLVQKPSSRVYHRAHGRWRSIS